MLKIFVRKCGVFPKEYVYRVDDRFELEFESEWLMHDFVKRIINEIDETEVRYDGTLYNSTLGPIVPKELSTGVKSLILIYELGIKVSGERMGDNCLPYLLELSEQKDVYMALNHLPTFPCDFTAEIINSGVIVHTIRDFVNAYIEEDIKHERENHDGVED